MNDIELDEMLSHWRAPEPGSELRARVGGMQSRKRLFAWPAWANGKGLIFGLTAGAAMFLLATGIAAPQTFVPRSIPFVVDFEYLKYQTDETASITEYRTEALRDGVHVVLWSTVPDQLLITLHNRIGSSLQNLLWPLIHEVHRSRETVVTADVIAHDCVNPAVHGPPQVLRHEKILGYDAAVILLPGSDEGIYKEWRAPALSCFVVRSTYQQRRPDGSFRLTWEMLATKITVNRAQ